MSFPSGPKIARIAARSSACGRLDERVGGLLRRVERLLRRPAPRPAPRAEDPQQGDRAAADGEEKTASEWLLMFAPRLPPPPAAAAAAARPCSSDPASSTSAPSYRCSLRRARILRGRAPPPNALLLPPRLLGETSRLPTL